MQIKRILWVLIMGTIVFSVPAILLANGSSETGLSEEKEDTNSNEPTEVYGIAVTQLPNDHVYPITLAEDQWKEILDPFAYHILREKGTERAWTGPLNENKSRGIYYSAATGQPLFHSDAKYDSGTGWPSFYEAIDENAMHFLVDNALFSTRLELVDSLSGSHLGHVFPDGPEPTGLRYCMNSAALIFVPEGEDPPVIPGLAEAIASKK